MNGMKVIKVSTPGKASSGWKWRHMVVAALWVLSTVVALQQFVTSRAAGNCELPDGLLARCDTTGEISFITGGERRQFSGEVYEAFGSPPVHVNETGTCPRLLSCPAGDLMPPPDAPGRCRLPEGTVARCKVTGDIFLIAHSARRKFSAETYAAYLAPPVQLNESGTCPRIFACPLGNPMPAPEYTGGCPIADNSIVRCAATGGVALIERGQRRMFSPEAYRAYGYPSVQLNETGGCPRLMSCPAGDPVPVPDYTAGCGLEEGALVRCASTGEIAIIEGGKRRQFSAEGFAAYGTPPAQLVENSTCPRMFTCAQGPPIPKPTGKCPLPNDTLARCNSTGQVFVVDAGKRRQFSGEAYAAYGSPPSRHNETGICAGIYSCKLGKPVPLPSPGKGGKCGVPDGTVVQCNSTGDIALIEKGLRRRYSREVYIVAGSPAVGQSEGGICPRMFSCPPGEPVRATVA